MLFTSLNSASSSDSFFEKRFVWQKAGPRPTPKPNTEVKQVSQTSETSKEANDKKLNQLKSQLNRSQTDNDAFAEKLKGADPEHIKIIAGDKGTSQEVLLKLRNAFPKDEALRKIIENNPSSYGFEERSKKTADDQLGDLLYDHYTRIKGIIPEDELRNLLQNASEGRKNSMAQNRRTPEYVLALMAKDSSTNVRRWVAWNESTPKGSLIELSNDKHIDVRKAVALNPKTPENILGAMYIQDEDLIAEQLAGNRSCPEIVMSHIINSFRKYKDENMHKEVGYYKGEEAYKILALRRDLGILYNLSINSQSSRNSLAGVALVIHDNWQRLETSDQVMYPKKAYHRLILSNVANHQSTGRETLILIASDHIPGISEIAEKRLGI